MPRSTALRMAVWFLLLFGGTSALLMGGVYWISGRVLLAQIDHAIEEDIHQLAMIDRHRGGRGLAAQVVRQARLAGEARAVFLLAEADGRPLAGTLSAWPDGLPVPVWATVPRGLLGVVPADIRGATESRSAAQGLHDEGGPGERRLDDQGDEPDDRRAGAQSAVEFGADHTARSGSTTDASDPAASAFGGAGAVWPPWHRGPGPWGGPGMEPGPSEGGERLAYEPPRLPWRRPFGPPGWPPGADRVPEAESLRLATVVLPNGRWLLVGRDLGSVAVLRARMAGAMRLALAGMLVVGLVGGLVMSRRVGRRLEAINRTSRAIVAGDLARRAPQGRGLAGDDIDQLAAGFNAMLDRIETLMAGVRHVSDTIAHDLRTPLARLRNRLEGLRDAAARSADTGAFPPDPTRTAPTPAPTPATATDTGGAEAERVGLEAALAEVDGLLSTFNALLRIAQVETGGRRVAFAPVDLGPLLTDVAELYDAVAADRGVALVWPAPLAAQGTPPPPPGRPPAPEPPPAPVMVLGDRDLLFQALANLLDNAVKYSPDGGRVDLALGVARETVTIEVRDQGPGIPEPDRQRVFERFARLDQARSTPGNGLGLTMVAAVVEAHGGRIVLADGAGDGKGQGGGGGLTVRLTFARRMPATP